MKLTATQLFNWQKLKALAQSQPLHLALRELAMELISAQPEQDKIVVRDQVRRNFKNNVEKQEFIDSNRQAGVWGDDDILTVLADALGYKVVMHLPDTTLAAHPYVAYAPEQPTDLILHAENTHAASGGFHWQIWKQHTLGLGNCLYNMIAQQIQMDFPSWNEPAQTPAVVHQFMQPVSKASQLETDLALAEQLQIEEIDQDDQRRYNEARFALAPLSTELLVDIYHHALSMALKEGDTYLELRPYEAFAESGNDAVENAIHHRPYDKFKSEAFVREELVHMLAKEAWRNPTAAAELKKFLAPTSLGSCASQAGSLPISHAPTLQLGY
ncbi:MAG TPA: hypothetical protein VI522_00215 [Gammaproteobacteria bacterium]|nr:hypothetical protein [Gammaproteobacteria bacterium]